MLVWWYSTKHIEQKFVIDFYVRNLDSDLSIETAANFTENLVYSSRNQSTVLIICGAASHSEGFASASLAITENGTVEAINDRRN